MPRPPKKATPAKEPDGKRYPLNMRTTQDLRKRLERAAEKSGRSLAQEVEHRLQRSLDFEHQLVVARGELWTPLFFKDDKVWIILGDDPRDWPDEHVVQFKVSPQDLKRMKNYFAGAPYPYDYSIKEIYEAGERYLQEQRDIEKGK
jgi:hypothetical protein